MKKENSIYENYMVSVCLITYNHEEYISTAINGVLNQKVDFEYELIIADDFSTDRTREIVLEYKKKHPKLIKLILQKKNVGPKKNWLDLLSAPKGKYVAYFEGDDYWTDPYKLQKQVDFLEANPDYVLTGHDAVVIDENGNKIKDSALHGSCCNGDASARELKQGFWVLSLSICFRNVLKEFPSKIAIGDTALTSFLGNYGKYKYFDDIKPAVYRVHSGGTWSLKSPSDKNNIRFNLFYNLREYYREINDSETAKFYTDTLISNVDEMFLNYLTRNRILEYSKKFFIAYKPLGRRVCLRIYLKNILIYTIKRVKGKFRLLKSFFLKIIDSETLNVNYFIKKIQLKIYNCVHKTKYSILKIKELKELKEDRVFLKKTNFISVGNKVSNKKAKEQGIEIPNLSLYILENILINVESSALTKKNKLYYEKISINERFNDAHIKYHNHKYAVADMECHETIDEGFFLGGNGSYNWYHFMIEILPKVLFMKTINCKTILISNVVYEYFPTMYEALTSMVNQKDYVVKILNHKKNYKVKKMFFINEINKMEFNKINPKIKNFTNSYFREDLLFEFRKTLLEKHIIKEIDIKENYKKIFIWRESTHRIAKNRNEVLQFLESKGFQKINPAKLNLQQQIQVFNSAEIVVGTTGAAWTNLIFCKPNTKAVIFSSSFFKDFTAFSNLAKLFDVNLTYLYYYHGNASNHSESDFYIDIEKLESILKNHEK